MPYITIKWDYYQELKRLVAQGTLAQPWTTEPTRSRDGEEVTYWQAAQAHFDPEAIKALTLRTMSLEEIHTGDYRVNRVIQRNQNAGRVLQILQELGATKIRCHYGGFFSRQGRYDEFNEEYPDEQNKHEAQNTIDILQALEYNDNHSHSVARLVTVWIGDRWVTRRDLRHQFAAGPLGTPSEEDMYGEEIFVREPDFDEVDTDEIEKWDISDQLPEDVTNAEESDEEAEEDKHFDYEYKYYWFRRAERAGEAFDHLGEVLASHLWPSLSNLNTFSFTGTFLADLESGQIVELTENNPKRR